MGEKFNLTWNEYQSNIAKSFSSLRHGNTLNDVTLVSDDNVHISAHKVVLSSCSGYFRDIFSKNIHAHPMLCLVGVSSKEVNHVLDYIYNGQVQIHQDSLDIFLEVAQKFQLEGLIGQTPNEMSNDNLKAELKNNIEVPNFLNNIVMPNNTYDNEVMTNKKELSTALETALVSEMFSNIGELDSRINEEIFRNNDGSWQCGRCPKISRNKGHIREHFEIHIEGLSFPCQFCDTTCRSRHSLRTHHRTHRK